MADQKEIDRLFRLYKETGDNKYREEIAKRYMYLAEILAKKFVGRGVEYDDLYQTAALAVWDGIESFDPENGAQFTTYITPSITGKIKNYFRDSSRLIKLPRKMSAIGSSVKAFVAKYQTENGKKPTAKEIANALSLSEEDVVSVLEMGGVVSLDTSFPDDEDNVNSLYSVLPKQEVGFEKIETRDAIESAMRDFTAQEKAVIKFRFVDELSQAETAKRLDVSQMYVSRLERKLLARLKERLQEGV